MPAALADAANGAAAVIRVLSIGPEWYEVEDRVQFMNHLNLNRTGVRLELTVVEIYPDMLRAKSIDEPDEFDVILLNLLYTSLLPESLEYLTNSVLAVTLKQKGLLIVGRNSLRKECCSNIVFAAAGFMPALARKGLPTRRRFKTVGGGYVVFDTLRNWKKQAPIFSDPSLRQNEIVDTVSVLMNMKRYIASIRYSDSIPSLVIKTAQVFCDAYMQDTGLFSVHAECNTKLRSVVERFILVAHREKKRRKCPRRRLMIVAHSGDELLFGGRALLGEPACWTVVVVTTAENRQTIHEAQFLKAMSMIGAEGFILPYLEGHTNVPFATDKPMYPDGSSTSLVLDDWIYFWAGLDNWDRIVTHGPLGECEYCLGVGCLFFS